MFKNNQRFAGLATVIILLFSSVTVYAERLIPFQGRLTDGAKQPIQGVERVTFVIYDEPTGGTALWTEVHDSVSIIAGQVNVLLGSKTNLDDPDGNPVTTDTVNFTNPRYVGITIGVETNQEMLPRHQLVPSFHARTADNATEAAHAALADLATLATDSDNLGGFPSSHYAVAAGTSNDFATLTSKVNALEAFANAYTVPTGTVMPFAGENLPPGEDAEISPDGDYYFCEGGWISIQNVNGLVAENQALFDVIGYRYGKDVRNAGVDIYFRLPDYRGRFLRGWANGSGNDPDRNSRTGYNIDGNAITGDFVGTKQADGLREHAHDYRAPSTWGSGGTWPGARWSGEINNYGNYTGKFNMVAGTAAGDTRPINTSVRYIIKR